MAISFAAEPSLGSPLPPAPLIDRDLAEVCALLRNPAPGSEVGYWLRFFAAFPTPLRELELKQALDVERATGVGGAELEARTHWLVNGTSDAELLALDPTRDHDRIHQRVLSLFRVESRVLETLAINRIAQSTSLLLLIRATGKAEARPALRFYDTYSLLSSALEWGVRSERGGRAVARIRDVHSRYEIPNDGMKYILLETAFTWLEGAERIAHRPLHEIERLGFFHAYVELGQALGVQELTHDHAAMQRWVCDFNHENRDYHPSKRDTFERIVDASLAAVPYPALAHWFKVCLRLGMDEPYREATGHHAPSPDDAKIARKLLFNLGSALEASVPGPLLRSLAPNPERPAALPPELLGSSQRSRNLPPQRREADLPEFTRHEVAQHCHAMSLWLIIGEEVFDLTHFVQIHPGGREVLFAHAGRDATAAFNEARHPELVQVLRNNYRIGKLRAADLAGSSLP